MAKYLNQSAVERQEREIYLVGRLLVAVSEACSQGRHSFQDQGSLP